MRCTQTLTADSGTFSARATCATGAGSGVAATTDVTIATASEQRAAFATLVSILAHSITL
jgi:hypothetical protein